MGPGQGPDSCSDGDSEDDTSQDFDEAWEQKFGEERQQRMIVEEREQRMIVEEPPEEDSLASPWGGHQPQTWTHTPADGGQRSVREVILLTHNYYLVQRPAGESPALSTHYQVLKAQCTS